MKPWRFNVGYMKPNGGKGSGRGKGVRLSVVDRATAHAPTALKVAIAELRLRAGRRGNKARADVACGGRTIRLVEYRGRREIRATEVFGRSPADAAEMAYERAINWPVTRP